MKTKKSFVLIFTITILSLVTILTHQLLRLVNVGTNFDRAMVDREKAEMLALGGINLAIAQLTIKTKKSLAEQGHEKESKEKKSEKKSPKQTLKQKKAFLQKVLPHLNRWQTFNLEEEIDGIDGEVKFCISCENGKIDINEAFDFKKQEFKPVYKKFLSSIRFKKFDPGKKGTKIDQFIKQVTDFLKKRKKKIDDITELQLKTGTAIFYEPPRLAKKPKDSKPNKTLAINDIFTTWNKDNKLEALFLSDALCAMLGLRRPTAYDAQLRKDVFKKIVKNFKFKADQNTEEYWKTVKPLYQPKSSFKIKNVKIFSSTFEPTTYSVLSSGKVGNVEQRVLAILEKSPEVKLVRLYWI